MQNKAQQIQVNQCLANLGGISNVLIPVLRSYPRIRHLKINSLLHPKLVKELFYEAKHNSFLTLRGEMTSPEFRVMNSSSFPRTIKKPSSSITPRSPRRNLVKQDKQASLVFFLHNQLFLLMKLTILMRNGCEDITWSNKISRLDIFFLRNQLFFVNETGHSKEN